MRGKEFIWHDGTPPYVGWYNARAKWFDITQWSDQEGLYWDGCKDSLWRYWDGEHWSVSCSQLRNKQSIKKRLEENPNTYSVKKIVFTYRYPDIRGIK